MTEDVERWKQESADFHFPPIEDRARAVYTDVRYVIWRDRGQELINGFDYHRRIRIPGNCSVSFSISSCLKLVYIRFESLNQKVWRKIFKR